MKSPIVQNRNCGDCALCCKIMAIAELDKPKDIWCQHCSTRKSCGIYDTRPMSCRQFYCGYLTHPDFGEEWKPLHSKMVIVPEMGGQRVVIHVDPGRPDSWKREPYYSTLKQWAKAAIPAKGQVVVYVNGRTIVVLPDKDVDLGIVAATDMIVTVEHRTPMGMSFEITVVPQAEA